MKVIEDNWGSFPRTETCTKCKSKVELESREECENLEGILCRILDLLGD